MTDSTANHCDNRPIGIFDSGLGGLTVAAALRKLLPQEDLIYLGDTARVPYGNKSEEAIRRFACQDVTFLLKQGVKAVVFACNTAAAVALEELKKKFPDTPLLGVIDAGIAAALHTPVRRLTVIGTRATVNSDSYRRGIHAVRPSMVVESIACPLLVPLAEEGFTDSPLALAAIDHYLGHLKEAPPEALLLGCTHYPLFLSALDGYFGGRVRLIDSATACAAYVRDYLVGEGLAACPGKTAQARFFVTDLHSEFYRHAIRFFGASPERVSRVSLDTD